jgi:hypothetical protein
MAFWNLSDRSFVAWIGRRWFRGESIS